MKLLSFLSKAINPFWWYKITRLRLELIIKAKQTQEVRQQLQSFEPQVTDATHFQEVYLQKYSIMLKHIALITTIFSNPITFK